jgi:hypothetical protein
MKISATTTFMESLDRFIARQRWYWVVYDFIRYDIPNFFRNIWIFRKALREYHWWDSHGTQLFMKTSFEYMAPKYEKHGLEVESSKSKKVAKMYRAAKLLENNLEDKYVEMAEKELGEIKYYPIEFEPAPDRPGSYQIVEKNSKEEQAHERKVFQRAREIEQEEWEEFCNIIKGQDYSKFDNEKDWDEQFDGSGLKIWWD